MRLMKKQVSHFGKIYMIVMMAYIIFLFYYIIIEIQSVHSSNAIIKEQQEKLALLIDLRNERHKTKLTMLTPEYQDRIQKETQGILASGEKEVLLHSHLQEYFAQQHAQQQEELNTIFLQKPIINEWKEVFFP